MLIAKRLKTGLLYSFLVSMLFISGCKQVLVSGWASQSKTLLPKGNVCTNHNGGKVSINVPGPGKIMVTAQAMLGLKSHTAGIIDMTMVHIGTSATDCTLNNPTQGYNQMGFSIPKDEPSWTASVVKLIPVSLSRTFQVNSEGSKTYFLNGRRVSGNGDIKIWESSMQAVYYPDK